MSFHSTPMFSDDWWGSATPSATLLDSYTSASNHDGIAFKFIATSNVGIEGILLNWMKSAGTPTVDIGIETLTSGVPATTAAYVDGLFKSGITPTPTGTAAAEYISLNGFVGALTPGVAYALTVRVTNVATGTITVNWLSANSSGAPTRNSVAAFTKADAGVFTSSASRISTALFFEENFGTADTGTIARFTLGIKTTTPTAFGSTSSPDEIGMKWTQARTGSMSGFSFWGAVASMTASTFDAVLYEDDVAVMTYAVPPAFIRANASTGIYNVPLLTEQTLQAGKTYRLCLRPATTNTITLDLVTFYEDSGLSTAAALRELAVGPGCLCRRVDAGAWTDETNRACTLNPITYESLTDAAGGSGGGMLCASEG